MKNILTVLSLALIIMGCESASDVQSDIDVLKSERLAIQRQKDLDNHGLSAIRADYKRVEEELKIANIYLSGKEPKYILRLKLKQSHFSLDISKHIKDGMNAIEFEIAVDKEYYQAHQIGNQVIDKFRAGSAVLYGSFGNWKMTVVSKRIIEL